MNTWARIHVLIAFIASSHNHFFLILIWYADLLTRVFITRTTTTITISLIVLNNVQTSLLEMNLVDYR